MTSYNAIIELTGRYTPRRIDTILDALAGHGPSIAPARTGAELTITFDADNLPLAAIRALQLAADHGNPTMTSYNAIIELTGRYTPRRIDTILDALAGHGPSIAPARTGAELTITFDADNLPLAAIRALQLAADHGNPTSLTVMTTDEYDRRVDDMPTGRLLDTGEVAQMLGVSPQRVRQLNAAGRFGHAERLGNALAWPQEIIEAYAAARTNQE